MFAKIHFSSGRNHHREYESGAVNPSASQNAAFSAYESPKTEPLPLNNSKKKKHLSGFGFWKKSPLKIGNDATNLEDDKESTPEAKHNNAVAQSEVPDHEHRPVREGRTEEEAKGSSSERTEPEDDENVTPQSHEITSSDSILEHPNSSSPVQPVSSGNLNLQASISLNDRNPYSSESDLGSLGFQLSFTEEDPDIDIPTLVEKLNDDSPSECIPAVFRVRKITKLGKTFNSELLECNGLPALLKLIQSDVLEIQEHAVTSILNLSLDTTTHEAIFQAGAVPLLISTLENRIMTIRLNAAAAIFSLSRDSTKREVFQTHGAIKPLLKLLVEAPLEGQKDVMRALFHISACTNNISAMIEAGSIPILIKLIGQPKSSIEDNSIAILSMLSKKPEALRQIFDNDGVERLCSVLDEGSKRAKEDSLSVLLQMAQHDSEMCQEVQIEIYVPILTNLIRNGTSRTKEKATKLLKIIRQG